MELTLSAAGKVFLIGEYAVSRGGPAIVAAISRRLGAVVRAERGAGRVVLQSPLGHRVLQIGRSEPADAPSELRFVAAGALVTARVLGLDGVDIAIETTSELDDPSAKTGLGGSAAATAVAVSSVFAAGGLDPCDRATQPIRLLAGIFAHRLAQGGGSSADVIAATVGGLVWTRGLDARDCPTSVAACAERVIAAPAVEVEALALPDELALEVVATGRPARTGPRAARFSAALDADCGSTPRTSGAPLAAWMDGMEIAASELRDACRAASAARARSAIEAGGDLLARLAPLVGIPILTRELRLACRVARRCGAVAKSSGAGGGDCAIALVERTERASLRRAWSEAGLRPLALDIAPSGVRSHAAASQALHA